MLILLLSAAALVACGGGGGGEGAPDAGADVSADAGIDDSGVDVLPDTEEDAGADADADDTPRNACGGEGELLFEGAAALPGEACGDCEDGVLECGGPSLVCVGGSERNACGACGPLGAIPGESCGACGTWACEGEGLVCADDETNTCGGCEPIEGSPGTRCEEGEAVGVERCVGPEELACVPLGANGCGGSEELRATPGTPCGTCGFGVWACDGTDALTCVGEERGVNACGACGLLEGQPGEACGSCDGSWACEGEVVVCSSVPRNDCGGCDPLQGSPNIPCDFGGETYCADRETLACGEPGGNACGGAAPLDAAPGSSCGECGDGVVVCAGAEETRCVGASAPNACGGCGFLPGAPGAACGPAAQWTCENDALTCVPTEGGNACGGLGALDATPGDACGTCEAGRIVCEGFDATRCEGGGPEVAFAWPDSDDDGYGANVDPVSQCELETGFVRATGDCADDDELVSPEAAETCNGGDDDCDGLRDEDASDAQAFYADTDDDGAGDAATVELACAQPDGFVTNADDCDDGNGLRFPGADESDCTDPVDYNCDGVVAFVDADGDGFAACVDACDDDPLRHPGVVERCDGVDNNCNGDTDEGIPVDALAFYRDADEDEAGDPNNFVLACEAPPGFVEVAGDCDDDEPRTFLGNPEVCDGVDNNCDGSVDPPSALDAPTWYLDRDEDTFGDPTTGIVACNAPEDFIADGTDCNDNDPDISPSEASVELCDFRDNDCDGVEDESDPRGTTWYRDADRDGFGVEGDAFVGCVDTLFAARPSGTSDLLGDCDDNDVYTRPFAQERVGDGIDQNCNERETCYIDFDQDGYVADYFMTAESTDLLCRREDGLAPARTPDRDCDDGDPNVNPGAAEVPGNQNDETCDGLELCYRDDDRDGARAPLSMLPLSNLVATADVLCRTESGLALASQAPIDCDDTDPTFYPALPFGDRPGQDDRVGAPDSARDDLDQNCDGIQGDASTAFFVAPGARVSAGCGQSPDDPCGTLVADFSGHPCFDDLNDIRNEYSACGSMDCEFLLAEGVYGERFLRICERATVVGGYSSDYTTRSDEPSATRIERLGEAGTDGGPTMRVDEVSDPNPSRPGDLDRSDVYLRALTLGPTRSPSRENNSFIAGDAGGANFVNDSITFDIATRGEVVLDRVVIEGSVGVNAAAAGRRHGGNAISLAVRDAALVELRDTEIQVGRGGAASPSGTNAAEGGAAVGIALATGATLVVDEASAVLVTDESAGGAGSASAGSVCVGNTRWPGLRCREAYLGFEAPVLPFFAQARADADAPSELVQDVVGVEGSDGSWSVYAAMRAPYTTLAEMENACALWSGDLGGLWTIESAEEESAVLSALAQWRITEGAMQPVTYAMGLTARNFETPSWLSGAALEHTNWDTGEPLPSNNNRCLVSLPGVLGEPIQGWVSEQCSSAEAFVCRYPPQAVPCVPPATACLGGETCEVDPVDGDVACFPESGEGRAGVPVITVTDFGRFELRYDRDFDAARAACEASGAELFEPRFDAEQELVEQLLRISTGDPDVAGPRAWLGGSNRTPDDVFVWADGGRVGEDGEVYWIEGQPNVEGETDIAWVRFDASRTADTLPGDTEVTNVRWTMESAYDTSVDGFVCEWRLR